MQLLSFLLKLIQFLSLGIDGVSGLLDLFIQDGKFAIFLIQLVDWEVPVPLKVAVDLVHVFVLDDILFKQQSGDGLSWFQLFTYSLGSAITQKIIHHVYGLNDFVFVYILEDDSPQVVLYIAVPHLQTLQRAPLQHMWDGFGHLLVDHSISS